MKTIRTFRPLVWALVMAMPFWFGSCKKDSNEAVAPSSNSVQGTWRISGLKINPGVDFMGDGKKVTDLLDFYANANLPNNAGKDIVACLTDTKVTFNANGLISGSSSPKCNTSSEEYVPTDGKSTWKLDGNKLTITSGSEVTVYETSLSGNLLKMSSTEKEDYDGDGKEETYTTTLELTKV